MSAGDAARVLSPDELVARLRAVGEQGYHDKHPFHRAMHAGELTPHQLRAWIENRFYYQALIPRKDAVIVSRADDPELRRSWLHRISDHDGATPGEGGLARWLALAEAAGLDRDDVASFRHVLPGVRFAVDAYLTLVEKQTLFEAVASSLTELFAPGIMAVRLPAFEQHYPWVAPAGLAYFRRRLVEAPRDVDYGLAWVQARATTRELQERAVAALQLKCQILWGLLDALHFAYVSPGLLPPFFAPRRDVADG
jgi:pyrroloquinoline-quinone synthase